LTRDVDGRASGCPGTSIFGGLESTAYSRSATTFSSPSLIWYGTTETELCVLAPPRMPLTARQHDARLGIEQDLRHLLAGNVQLRAVPRDL